MSKFLIQLDPEIIDLFRTKHSSWKYEKEYRVIMTNGNMLWHIPGPITAIIFGMNTSKEDIQFVKS